MRDNPISKTPERNPVTYAAHRRQVLWQITLPFILAILVILALAVIAVIGAAGNKSGVDRWADISLIWLILPSMLMILIPLALFGGLAYGVIRLIGVLPGYSRKVQDFLSAVQVKARSFSSTAGKPVVTAGSFFAGVKALFRGR